MSYDFKTQLRKGEEQERILDEYFHKLGWDIRGTTMDEQRLGIDRWFRRDGDLYAVEYKADFRAHRTGNIYIETASVARHDSAGHVIVEKSGWLWTTTSNFLMYYIPGSGECLVFFPEKLREYMMGDNGLAYPVAHAQNKGYFGLGKLVPVKDARRVAARVLTIA